MHLNKSQIFSWVTLERGNGLERARQTSVLHGLLHRDAVRIDLRKPCWVKRPCQRAGGQKGRTIALAFFFGKANHFDSKR